MSSPAAAQLGALDIDSLIRRATSHSPVPSRSGSGMGASSNTGISRREGTPLSSSVSSVGLSTNPSSLVSSSGGVVDTRVCLFVGNLPFRVRWQDVKDLFRRAGTVLRADVSLGSDNRSRGHGTVLMGSREEGARAVEMFNGYTWQTRILEVRPDRLPPEFEQGYPMQHGPSAPQHPYGYLSGGSPSSQHLHPMLSGVGPARSDASLGGMVHPQPQQNHHLFHQQTPSMYSNLISGGSATSLNSVPLASSLYPLGGLSSGSGYLASPQDRRMSETNSDMMRNPRGFNGHHQGDNPKGIALLIGNLPPFMQWQDLKDLFRNAPSRSGFTSNILRADVALGNDGQSTGFGVVVYGSEEEAIRVRDIMDGFDLNGRKLNVWIDTTGGATSLAGPISNGNSNNYSSHFVPDTLLAGVSSFANGQRRGSSTSLVSSGQQSSLGFSSKPNTSSHLAQSISHELAVDSILKPSGRKLSKDFELDHPNGEATPPASTSSATPPAPSPIPSLSNPSKPAAATTNSQSPASASHRHHPHPGPISLPPAYPVFSNTQAEMATPGGTMSPLGRGLPLMTPSMPGFQFHAYPQTPPLYPAFFSPGLGPMSPSLNSPSIYSHQHNPFLNPAPGAPILFPGAPGQGPTNGNGAIHHFTSNPPLQSPTFAPYPLQMATPGQVYYGPAPVHATPGHHDLQFGFGRPPEAQVLGRSGSSESEGYPFPSLDTAAENAATEKHTTPPAQQENLLTLGLRDSTKTPVGSGNGGEGDAIPSTASGIEDSTLALMAKGLSLDPAIAASHPSTSLEDAVENEEIEGSLLGQPTKRERRGT